MDLIEEGYIGYFHFRLRISDFGMNLQTHYDLITTEESLSGRLEREVISLTECHVS